jgi:hypothetical protein
MVLGVIQINNDQVLQRIKIAKRSVAFPRNYQNFLHERWISLTNNTGLNLPESCTLGGNNPSRDNYYMVDLFHGCFQSVVIRW